MDANGLKRLAQMIEIEQYVKSSKNQKISQQQQEKNTE